MLRRTLLFCVAMLVPLSLFAAEVHVGGDYFLKAAEHRTDDLYFLGRTGTFAGSVDGDVTSLSVYSVSESTINADALFIGEKVLLSGTVGDDARLLGETVTVSGAISDDAVAVGMYSAILPSASIGGNLYIIG